MSCSLADEHAVIARSYYCLYNLPSEYAPGADSNRLPMHQSKTASYDNANEAAGGKAGIPFIARPWRTPAQHEEHAKDLFLVQPVISEIGPPWPD